MRNSAIITPSPRGRAVKAERDIVILVIDPSPLGRSCTLAALNTAQGLEASGAADVASALHGQHPDLLLLQGHSSDQQKISLAGQLSQATARWPAADVIVMADNEEAPQILESLKSGARGYLTSDVELDLLIDTIRLVRQNLSVYPTQLLQIVRDALENAARAGGGSNRLIDRGRLLGITPRQQDVLHLLALGQSNKLIARHLNISESTVKVHIRAIMAHAGAHNRTQIIAYFLGQDAGLAGLEMPA